MLENNANPYQKVNILGGLDLYREGLLPGKGEILGFTYLQEGKLCLDNTPDLSRQTHIWCEVGSSTDYIVVISCCLSFW